MKIAGLVLAAGAASRFGSPKQLADIDGKPMLQHCIDQANKVLPDMIYTVLGNQHRNIAANITGTQLILNPDWQEGIGKSIATGVTYLRADYDAILVLLADQPRVKSLHLQKLISLFDGHRPVCSYYQQSVGVPAIFPKVNFDTLSKLSGDKGAKALLLGMADDMLSLPLPEASFDIDRPEDLASWN
jgi:molybdenum cofactor cytidylyltransferase